MSRRRILIFGTVGVLALAATAAVLLLNRSNRETTASPNSTTSSSVTVLDEPGELVIEVDESIRPNLEAVPGLEEGDPTRPVGRLVYDDGETTDLVLGELIVATSSQDEFDGFLERHDATLVDTFPGEDGDPDEHLVRVSVTEADAAAAAAALVELEPDHTGIYRVSDPMVAAMLGIAAIEQLEHGLEVSINWVMEHTGIVDGDVRDGEDRDNPFTWPYLRVGGPLDIGVTAAWQLLQHHGKTGNKVKVAIADGGFFENPDFPDDRKIRLAKWNVKNPGGCGGGNDCPTHGTDVAVTAVGKIDNGYGTAGVAGQVGSLIAIQAHADFWTELRKIKKVVDEERPAVVNMSFSWEVKSLRNATENSTDRHLKAMKKDGALVIASAGNDGKDIDGEVCIGDNCFENRLVVPCESRYAICVGGTQSQSAWLHGGSNHGTAGGARSTQIYAPFCVIAPFNPVSQSITDTDWVCGTSFSAPFVAGAVALIKAADPSLGPDQIWEILSDTAHIGGVHFDHYIPTEHQRRINVLGAVMAALGVERTPPQIIITDPGDGAEFGISDWFDLVGEAVDYKGQPLEIVWESDIEGDLGASMDTLTVFELTSGDHTITARAVDVHGVETTETVTVAVVDAPPVMSISWPAPDSISYEIEDLDLVGHSHDPDTNSSLGDGDVEWELIRNGQVAYSSEGHEIRVPPGTLSPGSYQVVFRGRQGSSTAEAETTVHVLEVVGELPNVLILSEFQEDPYGSYSGQPVTFELNGFGFDQEDGHLPQSAFRWIARAHNGHEEVLCTGSSFKEPAPPEDGGDSGGFVIVPPPGPTVPPVIGIINNCRDIEVELGLAPGAVPSTTWALVLQAVDSDGQMGEDVAGITITFVTG